MIEQASRLNHTVNNYESTMSSKPRRRSQGPFVDSFPSALRASEALAEARHDAALYGKERRDRIRRYVRSREVEKEYERMMSEAAENTALLHGEAIQPLEPDDRSNA
jgi:hypothetical protein